MKNRRTELQADRALGALEGDEELELEQLLAGSAPAGGAAETERVALERAAAALDLAFAASRESAPEPLPAHLRASVMTAVEAGRSAPRSAPRSSPRIEFVPPVAKGPRRSWLQPVGWFAAAAAAGLALYLATERDAARDAAELANVQLADARTDFGQSLSTVQEQRDAALAEGAQLRGELADVRQELQGTRRELTAALERRETELLERLAAMTDERDALAFSETALLARVAQLEDELYGPDPSLDRSALLERGGLTLDWSVLEDPLVADAGVSGDVVWDPASGAGYMRFEGLPANDPSRNQYQLWIFDSSISADTPIDGGVFDVSSTGEVLVQIDPKIAVTDATMFAITLERPGGVVVSDRSRLLLLAQKG